MSVQVTKVTRRFKYNGVSLADLDPDLAPERIKSLYAPAYPELETAIVDGPTDGGDGVLTYEFRRAVGTKG